ncbi:hypothetical protein OH77DRAFT_66460 [Trametes cingulata]|nr:hypothetical protein OH77DRAFT_66460 [Trametes cingulata]
MCTSHLAGAVRTAVLLNDDSNTGSGMHAQPYKHTTSSRGSDAGTNACTTTLDTASAVATDMHLSSPRHLPLNVEWPPHAHHTLEVHNSPPEDTPSTSRNGRPTTSSPTS